MFQLREQLTSNDEVWNLFTRKEEYTPKQLDAHNRFNAVFSNYKNSLQEPLASKLLIERGLKLSYPGGKKFAVCLTHDVDDIYPPLTHTLLSTLYATKNLDFKELCKQLSWKFGRRRQSPYMNFRYIMEMEAEFGAKSTFYFMATDKDPIRIRYGIDDLKEELKFIGNSGWEVGLHIGYYSYNNLQQILAEKHRLEQALGKKVIGCRNHYLRFRVPDTWETLAEAGFKYDTTFGYPDAIGFRNGMCHPFNPFNLNANREINILEIPLTVMDGTLWSEMSLSAGSAFDAIKKIMATVENYNGVLTLLFHNYVFSCPFREQWAELYKSILQYCRDKNVWLTSAEEIYKWYHESRYLERIGVELR